jgi:hypothetical protein
MYRALSLATLLAATAAAQPRTWVVDQNGRFGAQFFDLPPAIAAAVRGDTILVRDGFYSDTTVDKGVRLLAAPEATGIWVKLTIRNLPAGARCSFDGDRFHLRDSLAVLLNQGEVHLERVDSSFLNEVRIGSSHYVSVTRCQLKAVWISVSTVSFVRCTLDGVPVQNACGRPALQAFGSDLTLVETTARGANGFCSTGPVWSGGSAGIELNSCRAWITGSVQAHGGGGGCSCPAQWVGLYTSGGELFLDPRAVAASSSTNTRVVASELSSLETEGAPLGGQIDVVLRGPPGAAVVLAVSPTGAAQTLPGFGVFVLDPIGAFALAVGTSPLGTWQVGVPVPNLPDLRGTPVWFQAASLVGQTLVLSTPAGALVR